MQDRIAAQIIAVQRQQAQVETELTQIAQRGQWLAQEALKLQGALTALEALAAACAEDRLPQPVVP